MSYISLSMIPSSSLLIVVLAALRYLLRGKISPRLQYGLWLLVALRLLLPFDIGSLDFSVSSLADTAALEQRAERVTVPLRPYQPVTAQQYAAETGQPLTEVSQEQLTAYAREKQRASLTDILCWVWLAGAAALCLWQVLVNLSFARRLRKTAVPVEADSPLPVLRADWLSSPCLFGA